MARKRTITRPAPTQAELLADDREDEVVEGVGQEQAAREPALAEAGAEDAAEGQREVALDAVEAEARRVVPRVEPRRDPVHLVAAHEHQDHGGDGGRRHRDQVEDVGAGQEEHRERGEREDRTRCRGPAPGGRARRPGR